jgi:hypothetical protein
MRTPLDRVRKRLRLSALASLSIGVALILGWLVPADHPVWRLGLGLFSLLLAAVNFSMLRSLIRPR